MELRQSVYINGHDGTKVSPFISAQFKESGAQFSKQEIAVSNIVESVKLPCDKVTTLFVLSDARAEVSLNGAMERIQISGMFLLSGTEVTSLDVFAPVGTRLVIFMAGV